MQPGQFSGCCLSHHLHACCCLIRRHAQQPAPRLCPCLLPLPLPRAGSHGCCCWPVVGGGSGPKRRALAHPWGLG
jgi:hypothetical protein